VPKGACPKSPSANLLSSTPYHPPPKKRTHNTTQVLMDSEDSAASLLRVLLRHYAERRSLPSQAAVYVPQAAEKRGVLKIVRSAAGLLLPSLLPRRQGGEGSRIGERELTQ